MLSAHSLSYVLPDGSALFQNLNFTVGPKKYGLVGANGAGKSTLARLLSREYEPSSGQLIGESQVRYLSQFAEQPRMTLAEYLADVWESPFFQPELMSDLLGDMDLGQFNNELSGGQWMRARLLKMMAEPTDLLVLDEPTNNLDRDGRVRLYDFVKKYRGGLLIISHDRELLSEVDEIWELSNQGLSVYGGAYSFYEEMKHQERERLANEIEVARKEKKKQIREHQEKIDMQEKRIRWGKDNVEKMGLPRIIASARKRQAQVSLGKIHAHERERDLVKETHFQELLKKKKKSSEIRLDLSLEKSPKGKVIFRCEGFNFRYAKTSGFLWQEPLNFTLYAQQRLVLKGANGSGKTTLLKLLTDPDSMLSQGKSAGFLAPITRAFVYLDQNYSLLEADKTVLENVFENSRFDLTETRTKLADYGFYEQDVFKKATVLSGGERLRTCLAMLTLSKTEPEVLILDEPTNNLDLETLLLLEDAIKNYPGTLIVVSHDGVFVEKLQCGQEIFLSAESKIKEGD